MTMRKVEYYTQQAQLCDGEAITAEAAGDTFAATRAKNEAEEWRGLATDALKYADPDPEQDTRS